MNEETLLLETRAKRLLLAMGAFLVLIALGVWQGDFHETLMNGTAL